MKKAIGIDYDKYEGSGIDFDYDKMMEEVGYSLSEIKDIQGKYSVGNTPLIELKNITALARANSKKGYGARIFLKDEATNPSGSFKARRASIAVHEAKRKGYKGIIAATSGNYGAGVASLAAKEGLKCIIVQETFDSREVGQPEIIEKARKCESFGAEVVQLTVGPELFYTFLKLLEETEYFNASLYTPFGIAGVKTLGAEIFSQMKEKYNAYPDVVVATNAGGGNLTGTAQGLIAAGATDTKVVAASVNLSGLHMASDNDFNRKSFTTGHTGFGIPFSSNPDRSDVPRSAARPLRYMDEYYTVSQGEVFYMTQALAVLEGLERGPAGNTSLAAAFSVARNLPEDKCVIVQESEYTGAGKHASAQLSFAKKNGIEILFGESKNEIPGKNIILPRTLSDFSAKKLDLNRIKHSYLKNIKKQYRDLKEAEIRYLCDELRVDEDFLKTYWGV